MAESESYSENEKTNQDYEYDPASTTQPIPRKYASQHLTITNIDSSKLSIGSQLIIDCLLSRGGSTRETALIYFFQRNMSLIKDKDATPRTAFRRAVSEMHGTFPLFIHDKSRSHGWKFNPRFNFSKPNLDVYQPKILKSSDSESGLCGRSTGQTTENPTSSENEPSFDTVSYEKEIIDFVKSCDYGVCMNTIIKHVKKKEMPFTVNTLEKKIRKLLKSRPDEFTYDSKTTLWMTYEAKERFYKTKRESERKCLPKELEDLDMLSITVSELYYILKSKGIIT